MSCSERKREMMIVSTMIEVTTNQSAESARQYQPWNNSPGCTAITLRTEKLKSTKDLTSHRPPSAMTVRVAKL